MRLLFVVAGILVLFAPPAWSSTDQIVSFPEFLVGDWENAEEIYPGTDRSYIENSQRTCEPALQARFVKCTTVASANGQQREYVFYIRSNSETRAIEMVGIYSNWDRTNLYSGEISEDGGQITFQARNHVGGVLREGPVNIITLQGPDEFLWEVFLWKDKQGGEREMIGIERARRVSR